MADVSAAAGFVGGTERVSDNLLYGGGNKKRQKSKEWKAVFCDCCSINYWLERKRR